MLVEIMPGKTSLLEAIYLLATLTSFHASSDRQLINFIEASDVAVGRPADFLRSENHRIEVRIIQEPNGQMGHKLAQGSLDGCVNQVELLGSSMPSCFYPR
jgi:DNA replication and repair protein RecF